MGALYNIAVIGSGTSGLASALFLSRDGHNVTLFEKFSEPRPLGAGIMLQPTGLACMACLGLDKEILSYGAKINHLYGQSANGSVVFDIRYGDLKPHLFGLGVHRGALFSVLHNEVARQNIKIIISCEIVRTEIAMDKRTVIDKSSNQYDGFDLVVDASGARSLLRAQHGHLKCSRPYCYGAVWGVCTDPGQAFGKDYLQQRYDTSKVMIGALAIGRRPSDDAETLAFFWSLLAKTYDQWRETGLDPWKNRVLDYWPDLAPFMDQFKSVDDLTFAQYSDTIMKQWHGDRLVFIGDSAHCTSPQLGQGANLGLIDALTLATCLKEGKDINQSLACYTKERKSHTSFYQIASRWLTPFFQSDLTAAAWLRDRTFGMMCKMPYMKTEMLKTLAGIKTGLFTHLNPGEWHADYDLNLPAGQ